MKRKFIAFLACVSMAAGLSLASGKETRAEDANRFARPEAARPDSEKASADYLQLQEGAKRQPSGVRQLPNVQAVPVVANPSR